MLKTTSLLVLVGGLLFASCPGLPPTPTPPPSSGYDCSAQPALSGLVSVANAIAGSYIVVLKDRAAAIQPLVSVEGVTEVKTLRGGFAARLADPAVTKLLADPSVAYIQQDGVKRVTPIPAEATGSWGLDRVDQRDLPLDGDYSPGADAAGVNAAVIDTGITNHPDFEGRLALECFSAHAGGCADGHGHGTHVAGTVAGKAWGVAKKAKLWAVRVLDSSGSGSDSDVIRGIDWVVARKQASPTEQWVANMSLGGSPAPALDRAVCDGLAAGVVFAIAAGNESSDASSSSPARVIQAITVGASDRSDRQASFSNYGALLDLYGPGVDIESDQPGGGTAIFSGTSMAAPHVAGAAALYLERHTGSSPAQVRDGLVALASVGKLSGLGSGSPNRLLYVKE